MLPDRFRILSVNKETAIDSFITENGLSFKKGGGFYELKAPEKIKANKEIALIDRSSNELIFGKKVAAALQLQEGKDFLPSAEQMEKYAIFVQSSSSNRKL